MGSQRYVRNFFLFIGPSHITLASSILLGRTSSDGCKCPFLALSVSSQNSFALLSDLLDLHSMYLEINECDSHTCANGGTKSLVPSKSTLFIWGYYSIL